MDNWSLYKVAFFLIISAKKPVGLLVWIIIGLLVGTVVNPWLLSEFNKKIMTDFNYSIYCLILIYVLNIIGEYIQESIKQNKINFVYEIQGSFLNLVLGKIYSNEWDKCIKLTKENFSSKVNQGHGAITNMVSSTIDQLCSMFSLLGDSVYLICLSPSAFFIICTGNIIFYFFIFKPQSVKLALAREKIHTESRQYWQKSWQAMNNSIDYIIHQQKDEVISLTRDSRHVIEKMYLGFENETNNLRFKIISFNHILNLLSILCYINIHFSIIDVLYGFYHANHSEMALAVLTLIISVNKMGSNIVKIMEYYQSSTRWTKDYEQLQNLLEKSRDKPKTKQIKIIDKIIIKELYFKRKDKSDRKGNILELKGVLNFEKGDSVLVKGTSGAGKSTLYDILCGIIPSNKITKAKILVNGCKTKNMFHDIEKCRSVSLQNNMAMFSESCYQIITSGKKVSDDVVWFFLKLVMLDDWFINDFNSNIHISLKDKLSGGQKSRILLAKTLFRASEFDRKSSVLILDEPDKGLPADLTIDIIRNIVCWFKSKGILLLTLHTREAQDLGYTQIVEIFDGIISIQ
ncbi:ABC-type multidrug transport system [Tupanvirus soda lake]|uniref:ABC-type multidrug transport system n=2 Tax=Tupanvirus TaxID=2094720 RepID=A0A6N1NLG8_9VIRU|nr:ABC-type multidrug transport system [Tupanvirus soda lake]QKU35355.1 ABC-type multidrug transport system [Tupanvirus soda lake]